MRPIVLLLLRKSIVVDGDHIAQYELLAAVSSIKTGEMCGFDKVCNEHLIHEKLLLNHYVTFLFDVMYCYAYVPIVLKQGMILTFYKDGDKPKCNSKIYRVITFSSSFLKSYETILLRRLHVSIYKP